MFVKTRSYTMQAAALLLFVGTCGTAVHGQGTPPEERLITSNPRSILTEDVMTGRTVVISSISDLETRDVRNAPAHVQVITARHISASGSRDLFEALGLVPGLAFGSDREGTIGVGVHGNWALEGRCLFMVNGTAVNEHLFGSMSIAERIPITDVDRIEVVMSPGTLIHGDHAALALVNVITRTADEFAGTQGLVRTGFTPGGLTRTQASLSGAHRLSRNHEIGYLLASTQGRMSNAQAVLPDGTPLSYLDSTGLNATTFQFNYRWKQLKAFVALQEEATDVIDAKHRTSFRHLMVGAEYRRTLSKSVEMTAKLVLVDQSPWHHLNTTQVEDLATNAELQRTTGSVFLSYKPTNWFSLRTGVQGYHQRSRFSLNAEDAVFSMNGSPSIDVTNGAVFAEANMHGVWGTLSAGQRFEQNVWVGSNTASRLAYTYLRGRFHGKLLWNKAFRTPTMMNLDLAMVDAPLATEGVTGAEAELGFKVGAWGQLSVNVHHTRINNPIIRLQDSLDAVTYANRPLAGTQGVDARYSMTNETWTVLIGAGLHRALADAVIPEAMLPEAPGKGYRGLPSSRAFAVFAWAASSRFTVRSRVQWQDAIWSLPYRPTSGPPTALVQWPSELLVNAGVIYHPKGNDRLTIDLGCNNLLDQERILAGPYAYSLPTMRLNGRELTLSVIFKFAQ